MRISSITKNAGKACNNRLYRHIRTFEKIVKNYFVIYDKFTTFFDNAGNTDNAGVTDNASNADNSGVTDYTFKIKLSIKKIFRCSRMDGIAENLSLNHLFPIYS